FYTMYYKKPVGRYHVQVCRTLPCALRGAKRISQFLREHLGLKPGEVSADGTWSFEEVECLGSCGTAPMCQINDIFFENLNEEKLTKLLDRIEKESPDLRFSTVRDQLGAGLKGCPQSEIV
ncbi:MAG: NAD(P)H-dependent oxidoreductase subunit E, partial [bacterium]